MADGGGWFGELGGWPGIGALGLGAAGTGLGIYDVVRANQQAQARDFAARKWLGQNPPGSYYDQLATPESMQAFARPWLADTAAGGVTSGGAWTQAVADAAAKYRSQVYPQSEQLRLNQFQSLFGPYGGYTNQPSAAGAVGAAGQSLQMLMLMNALRKPQPQQPPSSSESGLPGLEPNPESLYSPLLTTGALGDPWGGAGGPAYGGGYNFYGGGGAPVQQAPEQFYPSGAFGPP